MRIYLCSVCPSSTFIACRFVQNPPQKLQGMRFIGICKICFGFKLFLPTFTQSWFCCCCFNWLWILWSFPFCILVSLLWFGVSVLASGTAATAAPLLHCLVVSLALGVFIVFVSRSSLLGVVHELSICFVVVVVFLIVQNHLLYSLLCVVVILFCDSASPASTWL